MGPNQVLPLQATADLGAMAMKEYFAFPKAPALLNLTIRLFSFIFRTLVGEGSYSTVEMQSVYSMAPGGLDNK